MPDLLLADHVRFHLMDTGAGDQVDTGAKKNGDEHAPPIPLIMLHSFETNKEDEHNSSNDRTETEKEFGQVFVFVTGHGQLL